MYVIALVMLRIIGAQYLASNCPTYTKATTTVIALSGTINDNTRIKLMPLSNSEINYF